MNGPYFHCGRTPTLGELARPKFWEKFVMLDSHEIMTQINAAAFAAAPNYRADGLVNA
jgi:hypothetical protein